MKRRPIKPAGDWLLHPAIGENMSKNETARVTPPLAPEIPPGWHKADTEFDDHPAWDFDTRGPLTAKVVKVKSVQLVRRGEEVDVRLLIVELADGERATLWESATLQDLFDRVGPANEIQVTPLGVQALRGGRTLKKYHAIFR
tara:strand:- start:228 stop:656 length:429 start_codon:yes stop_codon:yes gene_type:complete